MEYQKIANFLGDASSNQPSKLKKKRIGLKQIMNQEESIMLIVKSNLKLLC